MASYPGHRLLLSGIPTSSGTVSGPVKKVLDLSRLDDFPEGAILITQYSSPDLVLFMEKAGAILTEIGGKTCHAAVLSREFNIPCVVRVQGLMSTLKDGQMVIVDGNTGNIYEEESHD